MMDIRERADTIAAIAMTERLSHNFLLIMRAEALKHLLDVRRDTINAISESYGIPPTLAHETVGEKLACPSPW